MNSIQFRTIAFSAAIMFLQGHGEARAQLTGSTVNVSAYYPHSSTVYDNPGNRVVSAAIEYPVNSYHSYSPSWEIDITDSQMIITDRLEIGFPFAPATFNGFILQVISGPPLLSATVDPTSGFSPVSLTVENGNRLLVNYQGVAGGPGMLSSIINIIVVPEPTTLGLLLLCVTSLASGYRRRKNVCAS